MKKYFYKKTISSEILYKLGLIAILALLSSCTFDKYSNSSQPTGDQTGSVQPTLTAFSTVTPSQTATTTVEVTDTPTPTITLIPTFTPLPTFLPKEKLAIVEDLFFTNNGCQFPCWWGFVPGETSWEEAKQTLRQYASKLSEQERSDYLYVTLTFDTSEAIWFGDYGRIGAQYFVKDDVIEIIEARLPNFSLYYLQNIFRMYGPPDAINVSTFAYGTSPVDLSLMYDKLGFWIYLSNERESVEGANKGCFKEERTYLIVLWDPTIQMTQEKIEDTLLDFAVPIAFPLEEYSSWTESSFYQAALDGNDPLCIELNRDDFIIDD